MMTVTISSDNLVHFQARDTVKKADARTPLYANGSPLYFRCFKFVLQKFPVENVFQVPVRFPSQLPSPYFNLPIHSFNAIQFLFQGNISVVLHPVGIGGQDAEHVIGPLVEEQLGAFFH